MVMRRVIAALVVLGLALGVFLLWPRGDDDPPDTQAIATTTTTTSPLPTSTGADTTSTSGEQTRVVETVEEAEQILRELWFGWFEGIYNQDEDRIREVVASEHQYGLALSQFESMTFAEPPGESDIAYSDTAVLLATRECTVIRTTASFTGFTTGQATDVHVLRWLDGWRFFSLWENEGDLWEADCEAQLS